MKSQLCLAAGLVAALASAWAQEVRVGPSRMPASRQAEAAPEKPEEFGSVQGTVLNGVTGEPLRKSTVILMRADSGTAPRAPLNSGTGPDGRFTIRDVPPGSYRLMAERAGFVTGYYGSRAPMRPGTTLTLVPKQELTEVTVKLMPQGVITGRVLDEDGEGVMNVSVQVLRNSYVQGRRQLMPQNGAMTNDLGEYRIFGLAPGRYLLSATYRPSGMWSGGGAVSGGTTEEGYAPTYYPGAKEAAGGAPLDVIAGAVLRGADIRLEKTRTVRVRGRVAISGPDAATRGSILLIPRDAGAFGPNRNFASFGRDGRFEIRGVTPGAYTLMASSFEDGKQAFGRQSVEVTNSNIDNIQITLMPAFDIAGTVRVENNSGCKTEVANFALTPREPGTGGGSGTAQPDGSLVIRNLSPDVFVLGVYGQLENCYVKSARMGEVDLLSTPVDLTAGPPGTLEVVLSANGGQVNAAVRNAKGDPAAGATVVLAPEGDRGRLAYYYKAGSADQYGRLELRGIAPGDYRVFAWEDVESGAWQDPNFRKPFEGRGEKVSIRESGRETVQLNLIPAAEQGQN